MIDPTMVPVFTGLTFEQLGQTVLILIAKCDALQARLDAMAAQPVQPAKQQSQGALDAARSAEQGDIKDAQRLDYCYQQAMGAFINAPITKQQWLNGLDAAIAARGAI